MDAATVYTLITITMGGSVDVTEFKTEALCLDAKSLALVGMTVAEKIASDELRYRRCDEWRAAWVAANPPREPETDEELEMIEPGGATSNMHWEGDPYFSVTDDGLIQDWPGGSNPCEYGGVFTTSSGNDDIQTARCIAGPEVE